MTTEDEYEDDDKVNSYSSSPLEALDLLATSDDQINLLLSEVNFNKFSLHNLAFVLFLIIL